MDKMFTLKDFELTLKVDALQRAELFQQYIDQLNSFDYKSYWIRSSTPVGHRMLIEGNPNNVIAFTANDYLGMSQCVDTINAGIEGMKKYGTGACAAQVIGGYLDIHWELESKIAKFVGQEDAMIFSSGFGANIGVLSALLGKSDIAFIDSFVHTSVLEGLKGTNIKNIGHNDLEYLDLVLSREKNNYITKLVIIDGVYSQDGDLSKLPEFIDICQKYGALLMVDDAHGIGVFGKNGRGTAEHFNCLEKVDIITGTFSKSFGCVGGFVAASHKLIQYLKYYAASNVFSAAPTPQVTCSVLKALELIQSNPQIRHKLWDNVNYLREKLINLNFDIGHSVSPIIPLMIRDNQKVYEASQLLFKDNIYATSIVYPAVRSKEARLRISVLATHEKEELDKLVSALCSVKSQLNL